MPTHEEADKFWSDHRALTRDQQVRFQLAVRQFIEDLRRGQGFRSGLRVKGIVGSDGIFEMTWAPDGRATFMFGSGTTAKEPHIIWRRVGTHRVLRRP